ncbi:hypothetical protein [Desulfobulbus elongatus]|uniref:hypothetical protein n=1 Tax=Desulfobulbus elongatus TaxID=53332 RepID=UPI0004863F94|nr:hypothetical protein [Desulfobulbus elongatus]
MRVLTDPVRRWPRITALVLMLWLPISTTGCVPRYVVIDGEETMTVKKSTLDHLYQDNEQLLQALEACRNGR